MMTIAWKELRENVKWGVLALVAMSAGLVVALWQQREMFHPSVLEGLCSSMFLTVTAFGGACVAFVLGLLQTVTETRPARYAFLVHRPVSRNRLFAGKVVGGLGLYLAAVGLPLLGAAWWVALPGSLGMPFDPRTVLPNVAHVLAGVAFYFAGMLNGIRPARWYGSRALGLPVAILGLFVVAVVPEWWMALVASAVFSSVLGLAAAGSSATAGAFAPQARVAKIALGLVLAGASTSALLVVDSLAEELLRSNEPERHYYRLDKNGDAVRVTESYGQITEVRKLRGENADGARTTNATTGAESRDTYARSVSSLLDPMRSRSPGYRSAARYFTSLYSWDARAWFYVPRTGRVEGYDLQTRRFVGSFGPDGFASPGDTSGARFRGRWVSWWPLRPSIAVWEGGVYHLDLAGRHVEAIYVPPVGERIIGGLALKPEDAEIAGCDIFVATQDRLRVVRPDGEMRFAVNYHVDPEVYPEIDVFLPRDCDRFVFWYKAKWSGSAFTMAQRPDVVVSVASDGRELGREELPRGDSLVRHAPAYGLFAAAAPPMVVVAANLPGFYWTRSGNDRYEFGTLGRGPDGGATATARVAVGACVTAVLVCAAVALVVGRRYAFTWRQSAGWCLASLILGPPALLTMLALYDWPARVACAECGKKRVVSRDECEHCGAKWAPPARDGTEICEPVRGSA